MDDLVKIFQTHSRELSCSPPELTPSLPPPAPVKAVIFDLYGTLFISSSGDIGTSQLIDREVIIQQALSLSGIHCNPILHTELTKLIKAKHSDLRNAGIAFPEIDIREIWSELLTPYKVLSSTQIETVAATYEALTNPVWMMPNLSKTLRTLAESDLELGIISNAQFYTHALFPALLPEIPSPFNPNLCIYSYQERQAKPGLHMFQKMVAKLQSHNIQPEDVLYLGNDMRNDIDPANRVGFRTVLFAGDSRSYRPRPEDNYAPADAVITDLEQLLQLIPHLS